MKHVAPQIKAALASLRANLPARIDVYNAEPEALQLAKPADNGGALGTPGVDYVFGGRPRHATFPVVEVAVPDGNLTGFAIAQVEADLETNVLATVWVDAPAAEFPERYELATGYGRCVQEVLLQPDAFGAGVIVTEIRFAYAASPEQRIRDEMEQFTIASIHFFTLHDLEQRP